jgi:hypothetical protein
MRSILPNIVRLVCFTIGSKDELKQRKLKIFEIYDIEDL